MSFEQAAVYEQTSIEQREQGLSILKHLNIEKSSKVLDIGCGTGYLSKFIADIVGPDGKVIAIDPDVERLTLARVKYPATNLVYIKGSAENLPGESYDVVFSNIVFQWVKDLDLVFQQAYRVLIEGGKFAFTFVTGAPQRFLDTEIYSMEIKKKFCEIFFWRNEADIHQLSSKYNFEMVYMEKRTTNFVHQNVSDMIENFMGILHGSFDTSHFNVEAMRNRYGDGQVVIQDPVLSVILQKN